MTKNDKGIDISKWEGSIDFVKVKKDGIKFVIPRDGWGKNETDPYLIEFVNGAKAVGLEVPGVYHFIYGISVEDAIKNAQKAISNVEKAGLPKTTVIWCDLEDDTVKNAKEQYGVTLTTEMICKMTEAFCNYVLAEGYPTGVYTNQAWMAYVYGRDYGKKYDLWLADYEGECAYKCVIRQTGSTAKISGITGYVDTNEYYAQYTAGTAKPDKKTEIPIEEVPSTSGKMMSKQYVKCALKLLERPLAYRNQFPYNCGLLDENGITWGDCWNIFPKTTTWSMALGIPICDNQITGSEHVRYVYTEGIKKTGLADETGDFILNNYCTKTTFSKMISARKAPCMLLINGMHMGSYIGDFERDGKLYNVSEFSPNSYLDGKMRSYVDEYGQRWSYKGGTLLGSWNQCGYLTAFLDYSDWDTPDKSKDKEPIPSKEEEIQEIIDERIHWYRIEIKVAKRILAGKYGNNPQRQNKITSKYGSVVYRIAQGFVNDIANNKYTAEDLSTAFKVAKKIIAGKYDTGENRRNRITNKYGSVIYDLAQGFVNEIFKDL